MSRRSAIALTTLTIAVLALGFGFALRPTSTAPAPIPSEEAPAPAEAVPELPRVIERTPLVPTPKLPPPSSSASATSLAVDLDERSLMETLRALRASDPELTLRLARSGDERFKDSADAGERAWFVVKALSDLGRHDEARVEGRALLDKYRGSRWAEDVYRHLFVNPATHPFERGYGKMLESDP